VSFHESETNFLKVAQQPMRCYYYYCYW